MTSTTTPAKAASAKAAPAPKVRENVQPNAASQLQLRSSDSYKAVIAEHSKLGSHWQIRWTRPGYAMLATGVKGEWATICVHGTVHRVSKGAEAEQAGRDRATWCAKCKADADKPAPAKAPAKTAPAKAAEKAPAEKAAPKPGPAKQAAKKAS